MNIQDHEIILIKNIINVMKDQYEDFSLFKKEGDKIYFKTRKKNERWSKLLVFNKTNNFLTVLRQSTAFKSWSWLINGEPSRNCNCLIIIKDFSNINNVFCNNSSLTKKVFEGIFNIFFEYDKNIELDNNLVLQKG